MDQDGRPSGDAYVELISPEEAEKAMKKHKEKIGHRWDMWLETVGRLANCLLFGLGIKTPVLYIFLAVCV